MKRFGSGVGMSMLEKDKPTQVVFLSLTGILLTLMMVNSSIGLTSIWLLYYPNIYFGITALYLFYLGVPGVLRKKLPADNARLIFSAHQSEGLKAQLLGGLLVIGALGIIGLLIEYSANQSRIESVKAELLEELKPRQWEIEE